MIPTKSRQMAGSTGATSQTAIAGRRLAVYCSSLAGILALSGGVAAQEAEDSPQIEPQIEQIVVTARRREESLQDVPVSITAFSSEALESNMIDGVDDYLSRTPNVSFVSLGSRDRKKFSIRGVSTQVGDGAESLTPSGTFAMYIDGFNVAGASRNPAVMDLERIEILRGPQGTYFGRNAIGGAINITTMKPQPEWYGEFSANLARYSTYDLEGIVNAPIVEDTLAARAVVKYHESDGYIENINPIGGGNDSEYKYGRLSLRYTPMDRLTVDLIGAWSDEVVGMRVGVPSGVMSRFAGSLFGPVADPDGVGFFPENTDTVNFNRPQSVGSEYYYVMANATYDFDNFTLTSITGYLSSDMFLRGDIDGGSGDYFYEIKPVSRNSASQEFRLQSTGENSIDWTIGAFLSRDRGSISQETFAGSAGILGLPTDFQITASYGDEEVASKAVFGEAVWHATDRLDLLLGMRYTEDEIDVAQYNLSSGQINNLVVDTATFDDFSPKFSASYYLTPDTSVYGTISKGFKAGGVQIGSEFAENTYDPESLWSYEAGIKSEFFDGRARFNAGVFYSDWSDMQASFTVANVDPDGNIVFNSGIQNAAEATNYGVEAEVTALLMDDLVVSLGAGYLHAEFDKFENASVDGETVDLSGFRTPNAPEWTLNGSAQYDFPVASYDGFTRLEWYYRDETLPDLVALVRQEEGFPFVVPSYHHVNLRAGIENERYSLVGYVENLFDEDYYTNAYQKAFVGGLFVTPSYQTWGLKFTVRTH